MVTLAEAQSSNARIATELPPHLIAVFVGATSGIGEATLKQFAKEVPKPRVYFIGRSQEAGDRIAVECKALNPEGEYIFLKGDVSLIKVVDEICREIKSKETVINLLFNSAGMITGYYGTQVLPFPNYVVKDLKDVSNAIDQIQILQRASISSIL
jgi:NADP-dependent 3-hydroxy acid dehydrogenase YdfG